MIKRIIIATLILISIASTALAKPGRIAYLDNNIIVVVTDLGYTCADMIGVTVADAGDVVYGIQDSFGSQEWDAPAYDSSFTVFVDEYWDTADQAIDWINQHRY